MMQVDVVTAARVAGPGSEFLADNEPVDIFLTDGLITDIAPHGALPARGERWDAGGAWITPGLWDNHVHTVQWALAAERQELRPASSAQEAATMMASAPVLPDGRRVGAGYRDALWADRPTLDGLDAATGNVPTYLINADVHSVWLNSAALAQEGFRAADGVLREAEAFEISRRLNAVDAARADSAVADMGRAAAARGVTGIVDFDMGWNAEAWPRRVAAGYGTQRIECAVYPADLERAITQGLRTGAALPGGGDLVRMGPLKIIADGSLGTRTAACFHDYSGAGGGGSGALNLDASELNALAIRATGAGLQLAIHAIGDRAAAAVLDAFALSGGTGTIEHAQLLQQRDIARCARLGVIASVQPQHALDDRDIAREYWSAQSGVAYPLAALQAAGVPLRFGSDAPVAPLDPWQAIAAAVLRTDDEREPWLPAERLTVAAALAASVRTAVRPGERADLVLCGADPHDTAALRTMPVLATMLAGHTTFLA